MVYPDINSENSSRNPQYQVQILHRALSVVIDYLIFVPVVSFLLFILFKDGLYIYKSFPNSSEAKNFFVMFIVAFVFSISFLQALFIKFNSATPGQHFMKIKVDFENKSEFIFFRAWSRQLGFVISFFFCGLPFLRILTDIKRQSFYEKMTSSQLVSHVQMPQKSIWAIESERKYWSSSLTALYVCLIVLSGLVFMNRYNYLITSPLSYAKFKNNSDQCNDFLDKSSNQRLKSLIAMNLVGTIDDECLNEEADFILWRNMTEDKSLAYFAKYITSEYKDYEKEYLVQACAENKKSEGCFWSQIFQKPNLEDIELPDRHEQSLLGLIVLYKFTDNKEENFEKIKKYSDEPSVRKFIVKETIVSLHNKIEKYKLETQLVKKIENQSRSPANIETAEPVQFKELNDHEVKNNPYEDVLEMVEDL